ncbi:hypothetical protein ACN6AX_25195 [Paenibacillus polymyxa]|uniref:hypothetical protein n=1 Tax=Paenibacillus polymyxa TaxID=1406 RepID=UPI00211D7D02|nr:hypothetical protein [Paenibacillus polymyxa]
MPGHLINKTNEILRVYGPPASHRPDFDNADYILPKDKGTIDEWGENWDCDGFYVPADRKIKQLVLGIADGPVAVKFVPPFDGTVTQEGAVYIVDQPNFGVFKPEEFCRPTNYPKCVNWYIPNEIYPEVEKWANQNNGGR